MKQKSSNDINYLKALNDHIICFDIYKKNTLMPQSAIQFYSAYGKNYDQKHFFTVYKTYLKRCIFQKGSNIYSYLLGKQLAGGLR